MDIKLFGKQSGVLGFWGFWGFSSGAALPCWPRGAGGWRHRSTRGKHRPVLADGPPVAWLAACPRLRPQAPGPARRRGAHGARAAGEASSRGSKGSASFESLEGLREGFTPQPVALNGGALGSQVFDDLIPPAAWQRLAVGAHPAGGTQQTQEGGGRAPAHPHSHPPPQGASTALGARGDAGIPKTPKPQKSTALIINLLEMLNQVAKRLAK